VADWLVPEAVSFVGATNAASRQPAVPAIRAVEVYSVLHRLYGLASARQPPRTGRVSQRNL